MENVIQRHRVRSAVGAVASSVLVLVLAGPHAAVAQVQTFPALGTTLADDIAKDVLTTNAQDPTAIEVTTNGRVIFAERTGRVKIWRQDGTLVTAGRIGVDSKAGQCPDCAGNELDEGGLHGLLLARDFDQTGHLYAYYSVPKSLNQAPVTPKWPGARGPQETEGLFRLSRLTLVGDTLDLASEITILENPAEWFHCCHYGGDMEWLADGTMLLSVGDDTISNQSSGYSPRDKRPGQEYANAELTAQNPADRRGKLLRLDPADIDGNGNLVPADNPFVNDPAYDPLVYATGFRSNWKFEIDPVSQRAIVGTVGPDAKYPSPTRGPAAHDELEVVPKGGGTNHGWPICIADNIPYNDYDWETGEAGAALSCAGMTPASIYYTYQPDPTTNPWIQMGRGGDTIVGGTTYRYTGTGALKLPARFANKHIWFEMNRGAMLMLPIDNQGNLNTAYDQLEVVFTGLTKPAESTIGPDGALYFTEYGNGNYLAGSSKISRFRCKACTPSPADYGGAPVRALDRPVAAAGIDPATSPQRELQLAGLAVVALAAAVALRRRRFLV